MSEKFDEAWQAWQAQLKALTALASGPEEVARVRRVTEAIEGDDVIGALCHDVKDPLASVLMGVALLAKSSPSNSVTDTVASAARRLDRIVTGVRDLDLLRRGEFPVRLRALPVASLVTIAVENQQKAVKNAVRVELEIESADINAMGDSGATSRIIHEILDNAVGFSNQGGVVHVTVTKNEDSIVVRVRDEGLGIDETHLPFVFDEIRNRAHRPRRGPGRGLPIARALAQLQGANLTINRRDPKGVEAVLSMSSRSETRQS